MKRPRKFKTLRSLAWLMIACLTMTSIAPGLTAFADDRYVSLTGSSEDEDAKGNGESSDIAAGTQDAGDTSKREDTEEISDDCKESADDYESSDPAGSDADQDTTQNSGETKDDDEDTAISDSDITVADTDKKYDASNVTEKETDSTDDTKKDDVSEEGMEEDDAFDGLIDLLPASPSDADKGVCVYNGEYYDTIGEAVTAIGSGTGTITLLDDAELEDTLLIDSGKITFDLGGHVLNGIVKVTNGSDVTVKNGTIDSGTGYWDVYASGSDDHPTRFTLAENAEINAVDYGLLICGKTGSKDYDGTGFVVTIDGTIKVTDPEGSGVWLQGKMQTISAKVCDLIVNGTIESGLIDGPGIAINGWGNVTVNKGARVVGCTGVEIRSGSLTVNGGDIIGSTKEFYYWPNTGGSTSTGAGITVNEHSTDKPINVDIKDGDISGYYALAQINTQNKENKINLSVTGGNFTGFDKDCVVMLTEYEDNKEKFSITGGTFTDNYGAKSDISAYLSEDYAQDDDGTLMPADSVVKFGDEYYSSFEDAISAIQEEPNPTLTMVADEDDFKPIEINVDQKLNMNLGGHNLIVAEDGVGFSNKGELTISGKGTIVSENLAVLNEGTSLTVAADATIVSQKGVAVSNVSGDLNISGTIESEGASAIVSEGGSVNVTDGAVTGSNALEVKGGEVNITGGTLTGTNGYAVYVTPEKTRDGVSVNIEGGEFVTLGEDCIYYESSAVLGLSDLSKSDAPVAVYCGYFSNERGLERFYATDKTDCKRNGRYFDVFTYERADITEQTCTQDGSTTYVCSYCGREYIGDVKEAPGHDWGKWEIVNEATLDKDGDMKRECVRCHEVENAVVSRTGFKLNVNILDNEGYEARDVIFEIHDNAGNKLGDSFTQNAEIYLLPGNYTIVITDSNGYDFSFTSLEFTLEKDYPITIMGKYVGVNDDKDEEIPGEGGEEKPDESEEKPDEGVVTPDDTPDDTVTDISNNNGSTGGSGSSGSHRGSGGSSGGGSAVKPASVSTIYVGTNGMTAEWSLSGYRFTKADGTHPSNEYLIIDGVIYAFYTNGYVISSDNDAYYSVDVVPAIEDIPVAEGTWELCGWWLKYSDGSYPRNDWAMLSHDGRTDRYYFDADGWMVTGWKQINGFWYYFGTDGALLIDTTTPDGHRVDAGGRLVI